MIVFQHDRLISLVEEMFAAAGCGRDEARRVGIHLVEANLVGHDSHGVIRIHPYIEWLRDEKVFANQTIRIVSQNDAIAVVDGQFGLGQSIGEEAMRLGIEKSAKHGVSVIALRNTGHLGRIGDWAEMAARAGMISVHFVNTSGAGMLVAPFSGIDRRLSANPFAAGVPTGDGELIIEMLAGALTGGSCTNPKNNWRVANGMLSIIIDRSLFGSAAQFFPEVERFVAFVKSSRTVSDDGEILIPGELEQRTKIHRLEQGIELDDVTWKQICTTCQSLNVEYDIAEPDVTN